MAVVVVGVLASCSSSSPPLVLDSIPSPLPATTQAVDPSGAPPTTLTVDPATTAAASGSTTAPATRVPVDGSTLPVEASTTLPPLTPDNAPLVTWNGKAQYIHGANLPWYNFGRDFGGGPTDGGASSADSIAAVGAALAAAHGAGMNVVRWWLFPGAPTQFVLDATGLPTALKDTVYQDIDAALALAKANDIAYTFTLFSEPTALPAAWITTDAGRQRLALVLAGLFTRYSSETKIMTWDVINEPEFDIWEHKASATDVRALITAVVDAVHRTTTIPVSVGGARLDGLALLTGLGLDYYTIHWYDGMTARQECLACTTYAEVRDTYQIDKPIVVGEFYAPAGLGTRFDFWRQHGYAGAMAWSLLPDKTSDHFTIDLAASAAFAKSIGLS